MYTFEQILPLIKPSFGEACCRKRVGYYYSLSINFGEKIYHNKPRRADPFYGEWQFVCYHRMWKIFRSNHTILEGQNYSGTNDDLDNALQDIEFGRLISIFLNNANNLVLELDNDLSIEFSPHLENTDERFYIFLPQNRCLKYHFIQGWEYGRSDLPSPNYLKLDYIS